MLPPDKAMLPFDEEQRSFNKSPLDDETLLSGQFWGELRVFLAVAKTKSFNRAAEMTNTSQPTVSRQVKRLQDAVGSQLFISTPRGVRLTQKGEELARALSRLDHTLYSITSDLKAETREAEGTVRVSITDGLNALFAAPALLQFSAQYPKIQLHLKSPLNMIELAGKSNGHDDQHHPEQVIRHSVQKARPTSFHSHRLERLHSEAWPADAGQSGTASLHSIGILSAPRPECGTIGSRRWRAAASRTTATIPLRTACW